MHGCRSTGAHFCRCSICRARRPSVLSIRSDIQIITLIVTNVRMAPCVTSSSTTSTKQFLLRASKHTTKPGRHRRRRNRYRATGQLNTLWALLVLQDARARDATGHGAPGDGQVGERRPRPAPTGRLGWRRARTYVRTSAATHCMRRRSNLNRLPSTRRVGSGSGSIRPVFALPFRAASSLLPRAVVRLLRPSLRRYFYRSTTQVLVVANAEEVSPPKPAAPRHDGPAGDTRASCFLGRRGAHELAGRVPQRLLVRPVLWADVLASMS
jgi:hypothetical protein